MPLLALAALYGAELIQRHSSTTPEPPIFATARHLGAVLLFLLFLLPSIIIDIKTVRFATYAAIRKEGDSTETLQSTCLNDFRFVRGGTRYAYMQTYMASLDEGIQLLRRHSNPQMRLNVLLFSDPFHIALGLVPATGGLVSLDGLCKASHPPLSRLRGNATHLLVDRGCQTFHEVYGTEWDALHLQVVEETKNYTLFRIP
jgi:hypothetical protein